MKFQADCYDCAHFGISVICDQCESGENFAECEPNELDFNDDRKIVTVEEDDEE